MKCVFLPIVKWLIFSEKSKYKLIFNGSEKCFLKISISIIRLITNRDLRTIQFLVLRRQLGHTTKKSILICFSNNKMNG